MKDRADFTREQAEEFCKRQHEKALAKGYQINDCTLVVGERSNDVEPGGSGPRYAIMKLTLKMAANGATYGQIIGQTVKRGDRKPYKIKEEDLLGYVCANGYCNLVPPEIRSR